jgi:hypothetical protein
VISRRSLLVGTGVLLAAPAIVHASALMPLRGDIYRPQTIDFILQRLTPWEFDRLTYEVASNLPAYWCEADDGRVHVWPSVPPNMELIDAGPGGSQLVAVRKTFLTKVEKVE